VGPVLPRSVEYADNLPAIAPERPAPMWTEDDIVTASIDNVNASKESKDLWAEVDAFLAKANG